MLSTLLIAARFATKSVDVNADTKELILQLVEELESMAESRYWHCEALEKAETENFKLASQLDEAIRQIHTLAIAADSDEVRIAKREGSTLGNLIRSKLGSP